MNSETNFKEKVLIGIANGKEEYLAAPSWDCAWYWGFGYLQNNDIHHHVDSLNKEKNMFDALREYYGETLVLSEDKLWIFCELMSTFYILKKAAGVLGGGGSHYTANPISEVIKNQAEVKRINRVIMPALFNEVYKLF